MAKSEYDIQAENFCNKFGIEINAKFLGLATPKWEDKKEQRHNHYYITISRKGSALAKPLEFDFYDSIANTQATYRKSPSAYDLLATISAESYTHETFKEFCEAYGYNEDSRKDYRTWEKTQEFAQEINAFFSEAELTELREIN